MSNKIWGYVGYGMILSQQGTSEQLEALGSNLEKALLELLYPEGGSGLEVD